MFMVIDDGKQRQSGCIQIIVIGMKKDLVKS